MGKQPVVAGGDAEACEQPHEGTGDDLDPGDAMGQNVPGDRDGGRERGQSGRAALPQTMG